MQERSICPGCGNPIATSYPFTHRTGTVERIFCAASCLVKWKAEQRAMVFQSIMKYRSGSQAASSSANDFSPDSGD